MERQNEASLSGKVAIVTGSSRGIGKRAALALARRGARLVVTARTVEASQNELPGTIGQTVKEIESLGAEAIAVAADLSNPGDLERIVGSAVDRFGGVDILVNNAAVTVGYNWSTPLIEMPRADWLHHYAVNLHAPFTLMQLAVPSMQARGGGRILNVTTGSAEAHRLVEEPSPASAGTYYSGDSSGGIPAPGASMDIPALWSPAYFSSKRALDRLANVIAPQLVAKNVFIMSVMPGWVATESSEANHELGDRQDASMISMDVPARILAYFAACESPLEYTGRVFFAEREVAALGLETDD
ncbi:MAG TPA: SDR family NAD(P)-dependent oxidoreductase [Trebonia sp.]|jgi:NAD(P)-dependent dehydrogenase (short-subunit alcohol dehydrogenase family)|nr:SDR family NAD(P)-dependent oxidoreductase [Trebonia sp.]